MSTESIAAPTLLPDVESLAEAEERISVATQWQLMWWRFRRHKLAVIAAVLLAGFYSDVLLADFFAYADPESSEAQRALIAPQTLYFQYPDGSFGPHVLGMTGKRDPQTFKRVYEADPSIKIPITLFAHGFEYKLFGLITTDVHLIGVADAKPEESLFLLGTDVQGRDIWSRLMFGTRVSLLIGLISVALSLSLGVLLGGISGYFGGLADLAIQRVIEILRSIPTIPLWMGLAAAVPRDWDITRVFFVMTIILALFSWTELARVVRGRFLSLREEDFVMAAELVGCSRLRIIFRHMVPSFLSHIIAATTLALPGIIIFETSLSFLGLGMRPPAISWGVMLQQASNVQTAAVSPWLLYPAVPVIVAILAYNFLGDGLRDAADPVRLVMAEPPPLLSVRNLKTYFFPEEGIVRAVDGASFDVRPGQTLGVVGESGCGKSVTARSILRIVEEPGRIVEGEIVLRPDPNHPDADLDRALAGRSELDLARLKPDGREMRSLRTGVISYVFQEPMTSFSPVHTIGNQITEAILFHRRVSKREARERGIELLKKVGIPRAEQRMDEYAFQLSGGLRQRAMIAMALSCDPLLLIADEPTTALDVTTQAQILDLLRGLQDQNGMAIMLITHNLGVVAEMCDQVVVMYLGRVVEEGPVEEIFDRPKHPYTRLLLASIPSVHSEPRVKLPTISGSIPHPYNRPRGCPFHPRCPSFMAGTCDAFEPQLRPVEGEHSAACFLYHTPTGEPSSPARVPSPSGRGTG